MTAGTSETADEALARLQLHKSDWYVRTGRRLLQERAAAGRELSEAHRVLRELLEKNDDPTRQLRAIWALFATGGLLPDITLLLRFPVTEGLARAGSRAVAHDRIEAMATALLAEHPGPLILCGASMGGMIAMEAARQAPDRIVGLALLGTNARPETPEMYELRESAIERVMEGSTTLREVNKVTFVE